MTWSQRQQVMVHKATTAAGWNAPQRYMAMTRAGCLKHARTGRPSVKHPRNTNTQFELFMDLAEACAAKHGRRVPKPRDHPSWRHVCIKKHYDGWFAKAKAIAREGQDRMPATFNDGLIQYAIDHTSPKDDIDLYGTPQGLTECTTDQLYRVVELLKAMVGRKFIQAGLTPRSFEIPAEARRRAG